MQFSMNNLCRYLLLPVITSNHIRSGDKGIRTLDPLLARQVLSQLSYAPLRVIMLLLVLALTFSVSFGFSPYGLKWTRTTDLTLIRRAL